MRCCRRHPSIHLQPSPPSVAGRPIHPTVKSPHAPRATPTQRQPCHFVFAGTCHAHSRRAHISSLGPDFLKLPSPLVPPDIVFTASAHPPFNIFVFPTPLEPQLLTIPAPARERHQTRLTRPTCRWTSRSTSLSYAGPCTCEQLFARPSPRPTLTQSHWLTSTPVWCLPPQLGQRGHSHGLRAAHPRLCLLHGASRLSLRGPFGSSVVVPAHHQALPQATYTGTLIHLPAWLTVPYLDLNLGTIAALLYAGLYILLEPVAGFVLAAFCVGSTAFANHMRLEDPKATFQLALVVHVVSWIAQFIGHGAFEGRAPALLDNLVQAIFLAPMFVWLEVLFKLGYRKELQTRVEKQVQVEIAKFKAESKNGKAQ
ncbi:hypothetical protein Purlil1_9038 [Purpureocillium lilacinum]|uniref:DUF962 domain-containing protein n=1 Tax=Purpureocillium lilacinum TaxID=33203 RepID=A0ABR0BSI5_PURLI|nr:hypothetical protein Purlil1_9038 [Purpureocillium lilacinum]